MKGRVYSIALCIFALSAMLLGGGNDVFARNKEAATDKGKKETKDEAMRKARGAFDIQKNGISNIQFITTNYGIFGLDVDANAGGGYWPRNSSNQYIFGGGIWFASQKRTSDTAFKKLCVISYNPNSGSSWMVPGRINGVDGKVSTETDSVGKYRIYFSTDFSSDGSPTTKTDGQNWPIWDNDSKGTLKLDRYFGNYIDDPASRNKETFPKGPAFISQEDIVSYFRDTDLRYYEGKDLKNYPLNLDFEQRIYSWGFGDYKDFIFLAYNIINRSKDTLFNSWMAPAFDMDIAVKGNGSAGAANDRCKYYDADTTLNMAIQWTNGDAGETGKGFGYIGFDFLESPIVNNSSRFIEPNRDLTAAEMQKISQAGFVYVPKKLWAVTDSMMPALGLPISRPGLVTFNNWVIADDPSTDEERYKFLARGVKAGDNGAGDKRFLMATGPFHLKPGDTARVVVGLIMASSLKTTFPNGETDDCTEIVRKDKFAQFVYDNNFKAPKAPDISAMSWKPLNNGVLVKWDSTSEWSHDDLEAGLDFMGYRLFRARRVDLDTFNVDVLKPNVQYSKGRGPFGWKQIRQWNVPPVYAKSTRRADLGLNDTRKPFIDTLSVYQETTAATLVVINGVTTATATTTTYSVSRLYTNAWANFTTASITIKSPATKKDTLLGPLSLAEHNKIKNGSISILIDSAANVKIRNHDSLLLYAIQMKLTKSINFYDFDKDESPEGIILQRRFRKYLELMMDALTNHRTYMDVGDDNGDGLIVEDTDPAKTEKLINNIDYYYSILAFDEGDWMQQTEKKENNQQPGKNIIQSFPLAPAVASSSRSNITLTISKEDSLKMGGLYNFRTDIRDANLLRQLYAGHEYEFVFQPSWQLLTGFPSAKDKVGLYWSTVTVTDKTDKREVAVYDVNYSDIMSSLARNFSENAAWFANSTTAGISLPNSKDIVGRSGSFTSVNNFHAPYQFIDQCFSFGFDYHIQQQGGIYRPDTMYVKSGSANTILEWNIGGISADKESDLTRMVTQVVLPNGTSAFEGYNNGPGVYEIEFVKPSGSGVERLTITTLGPKTIEVDVPYLEMKIKNIASYSRPLPNGADVMPVFAYPTELTHSSQVLGTKYYYVNENNAPEFISKNWPLSQLNPIGSYNLSAYGWLNGRTLDTRIGDRAKQAADTNKGRPVGTQGRYYLSVVTPTDTLDFTHVLLIGGHTFGLDYAYKYSRFTANKIWESTRAAGVALPTSDFKAGDKVIASMTGGALGLPAKGFKITAKVGEESNVDNLTKSDLEKIKVVPNPYYITHQGQASSDNAKLYFNGLPKKCTIRIYTIVGDLVRTINHEDDSTNPGTTAVEVWNLLSDGLQRVGSQTLIAQIETPNGEKTELKFTVVVGGFRSVR